MSLWREALNGLDDELIEVEKEKESFRFPARKAFFRAAGAFMALAASLALIIRIETASPASPQGTGNAAGTETVSGETGVWTGGPSTSGTISADREGPYRVVRYEIPKTYQVGDLYIRSYPTAGYQEEAEAVLKKHGKDWPATGFWIFTLEKDPAVRPFALAVTRIVRLYAIYTTAYLTEERKFAEGYGWSGNANGDPQDDFWQLLEALSLKTSPENPICVVQSVSARYAVLGDTAYTVDPFPDYTVSLPEFLEAGAETEIVKISMHPADD